MVSIKAFLLAYKVWFKVALYVIVFVAGAAVARWYYVDKIEDIRNAHGAAVVQYQKDAITKDAEYRLTLDSINRQLLNVQRKTDDEIKKPAYLRPIPSDGIGLLNDAIRTGKGRKPSK